MLRWAESELRWEDSDDDCNILASLTCDQIYDGTPDLICQCAPLPPPPAVWIQNAQGHCLMAQDGVGVHGTRLHFGKVWHMLAIQAQWGDLSARGSARIVEFALVSSLHNIS